MDSWRGFSKFYKGQGKIEFKLKEQLAPGLHATEVKLEDGQDKTKYQLYLYVSEGAASTDATEVDTELDRVIERGQQN